MHSSDDTQCAKAAAAAAAESFTLFRGAQSNHLNRPTSAPAKLASYRQFHGQLNKKAMLSQETAHRRSCSFRFKVRRQHSLQV